MHHEKIENHFHDDRIIYILESWKNKSLFVLHAKQKCPFWVTKKYRGTSRCVSSFIRHRLVARTIVMELISTLIYQVSLWQASTYETNWSTVVLWLVHSPPDWVVRAGALGKDIVLYSHGAFLNPDVYSVNGNQLIQYLEIVLQWALALHPEQE